ncbi:MAG: hypothetical protein ACYDEJ_03220 [Desulfitobacteriaceae bacterium]
MDLEQGLTAEFEAIGGLAGKVFPIMAVQGTEAPYLTYVLTFNERELSLAGHDGLVQSRYQIDLYHSSYANLKALKKLVITNIKTYDQRNIGGAGPYIHQVEIFNDFETYEDGVKLYRGIIEVNIDYNE